MFKNMKLRTKIVTGYVLITLVLVVAVGTTLVQVARTSAITNRIVDLRVPTAQSSLEILNGINHSLAALRGWIILGKDKFRQERQIAWSQEIEISLANMNELSKSWTNPKNVESLKAMEVKLGQFKQYQQEIEDIAQTIDNTPALKILFEDAAPQAQILVANITKMIDLEAELDATAERKALLGMMADVRGTTGLALANIRAFLLSGDPKFRSKFETLWAKNIRRFADLSANVELLSPQQREAFESFAKARGIFETLPKRMFDIRGGSEWNLANTWLGTKAAPTAFAIKVILGEMVVSQQQLLASDMEAGKKATAVLTSVEWVLLAAGVLISTVLGVVNSRSITRPINRIIAGLTEGSSMVASAATQVSSSSQSLAEGASEQAAAIEEVTSSIEEMASMTKQNAGNANEAKGLADTATAAADKGSQAMVRMSSAIDDIKKSSDETAKIIKTIDEIAFQTNLLALNAAVEAARAGEAGKGFAVVAEEVRKLAQRSAEAARNTADMIEGSVKNAENGVSISQEVGETLEEIATGNRKTNELVSEIAAASNEQSQGIEQINTAVTQMDSTTQSNAANAEESASASEEMSAQAEELNNIVGELQALVGGTASRKAAQFKVDTTAKSVERKAQAVTNKAASKKDWKADSPEDVIPLDSEKELSNF